MDGMAEGDIDIEGLIDETFVGNDEKRFEGFIDIVNVGIDDRCIVGLVDDSSEGDRDL